MKTALLLSGLPRYIDEGFHSIRESLIKPNNPDIFIHTWGDPNNLSLKNKLTQLFRPNHMLIEPSKIIHNAHLNLDRMMVSHGRSYQRDKFVEMVYSMWYSILQCNLLKEQCRLEHNIHYDYVIRARFDITYTKAIHASQYDPNIVYTAERPDLPTEMVDDRFAISSNQLMNIYCGGFNIIDYIHSLRDKKDGIFCGETLLFELFNIYNISTQKISGLRCNHLNHR